MFFRKNLLKKRDVDSLFFYRYGDIMCIKKLKIKVEIIIKNISKFIMWVFNKIFGDFFNNLKRIYKIIIKLYTHTYTFSMSPCPCLSLC